MKLEDLKNRIESLAGVIEFEYNGTPCGIDPINHSKYDMWYGDDFIIAKSIDDVMSQKIFAGKALENIFDKIANIDY